MVQRVAQLFGVGLVLVGVLGFVASGMNTRPAIVRACHIRSSSVVTEVSATRDRRVMLPFFRAMGWIYVCVCCAVAAHALTRRRPVARVAATEPVVAPTVSPVVDAAQWFRRVKPYCNAVEVTVLQRQDPAPQTLEGTGFHAACFALAGKIDDARRLIDALAVSDRYRAVGIVFDVGHPVADAGDDRSAAPIMELVVDYWPNHYMALYHAAMAEYMLGHRALARRNLTEFLRLYNENDGWRSNGLEVLRRLNDSTNVEVDLRRPREPRAAGADA